MNVPLDPLNIESCLTNQAYPDCTPDGTGLDENSEVGPPGGGTGEHGACIELFVIPPSTFVEVGKTWQFQAILKYSDQTTEDVTAVAHPSIVAPWQSSQPGVFSMAQTGLGTGVSAGIATVSVSYCGLTGFASVEVQAVCTDAPLDIVLCMDRSGSMVDHIPGGDEITKLVKAKAAAKGLADVINTATDQMGVVSFAGIYYPGPPVTTAPESTLDQTLTNDPAEIKQALDDKYNVDQNFCWGPNNAFTKCATGIGGGLQTAWNELDSGRHTLGANRVLVLMTDGMNDIDLPDPPTVAAAAKADGVIIVVIGLDISGFPGSLLSTNQIHAYLGALASPGLYFPAPTGSDLAEVFSRIPHVICSGYAGYGYSPVDSTAPGDPGVAGALHGLRWEMPCHAMLLSDNGCTCVDPADQVATMGGVPNQVYDVTLRIRGKVELKAYEGGTNDSNFLQIGGKPSNKGDNLFNEYSLVVSDPPQTFYLNAIPAAFLADWFTNPDCPKGLGFCKSTPYVVDFSFVAQIKTGATVTIRARSIDGEQLVDGGHQAWPGAGPSDINPQLIVPGVPPDPAWYRGQFLEMTVSSVSP